MEKVPKRLRRSDSFFRGLEKPFFGYEAWPAIDIAEEEDAIIVRA
jgi:HSP20 family molecular chaperone IbpA